MPEKVVSLQLNLHNFFILALCVLGVFVFFRLQSILVLLFVAWLFSAAVDPLIKVGERYRLPRGFSLALIYLVLITVIITALASLLPPLVIEVGALIRNLDLPPIFKTSFAEYDLQELEIIARQLTSLPRLAAAITSAFSAFVLFFTFGIITYYLVIERPFLHRHLTRFFGKNHDESEIEKFVTRFENQIGAWVRGQLFLMLIIGSLTYLGLSLLGVEYALPLAILAGFLELIPNLGPTISAIPAILIASVTYSLPMGLIVTGMYVLIQQIENNLIVPKVMRQTVGLHPLVTILLLIVGLELGNLVGAILAIPLFLAVKVGLQEWATLKRPGQAISQTLKHFKA